VAAVGGRPLAALPIVGGPLARVPAHQGPRLSQRPGVRAVTDAEQEVRLRVWRDNGWAMAAVSDRGRGIPARSWTGSSRSSTGSRTR
jgi:hypothetical protein